MSSQIPFGDTIIKFDANNIAVTANANILNPDITPTGIPLAWFVVYGVFQLAGRLKIVRSRNNVSLSEILNEDTDLKANAAYMFIVPVYTGESINIQYSTTTTASKLSILEVNREV
jgi:hypothetical protein